MDNISDENFVQFLRSFCNLLEKLIYKVTLILSVNYYTVCILKVTAKQTNDPFISKLKGMGGLRHE